MRVAFLVNDIATDITLLGGTIGYEVLTRLGSRFG